MKIQKLLFLLLLLPLTLPAQIANVSWGPDYKTNINKTHAQLIGIDDNDFYVLKDRSKRNKTVLRYDLGDEAFSEHEFQVKYNDEFLEDPIFIKMRNGLIGFSVIRNRKDKLAEVIAFEFDNGEFTNHRMIFDHDYKKYTKGVAPIAYIPESNEDAEVSFTLSPDSSKIVFINPLSNQDTKKEDQIAVAVFDENLNLMWSTIQDFPYKDKKLKISNSLVTNNGREVFLIGARKNSFRYFDYKVFKVAENDSKEYEIVLDEEITPVAMIPFDYNENDQTLRVGGLYARKGDPVVQGVFGGKLDLTKTANKEFHFSKFLKEELFRNSKTEYSIAGAYVFSNGNYQFLAESKYESVHHGGSTGPTITYYYNTELIHATIDPNGEVLNKMKIIRNTRTEYERNGYIFFVYDDQAFLLFDTKVTKEDKAKYSVKVPSYHSITKMYAFDPNGKLSRQKMLFTSKDDQTTFFDIHASLLENRLYFLGGQLSKSGFEHWKTNRILQIGSIDLDAF